MKPFGTIKTAPNGKYYGRYRHNGRDYYTPRRDTTTEVDDDLTLAHASIINGTHDTPTQTQAPKIHLTLGQWAQQWFISLAKDGYSPNTIRSYLTHWTHHILPAYAHLTIDTITRDDATQLYNRIIAQGKTPTTACNVIRSFSTGMKAAAARGYIRENPIHTPPMRHSHAPQRRGQALTPTQLSQLITGAPEYWKAAFTLASWGAMRYGEIAALTRADIITDSNMLAVTINKAVKRSPTGELVIGPPKSRAGYRTITIPTPYEHIITNHLEKHVHPEPDALLYRTRSGNYTSDGTMRSKLHETLAQLGLPKIRFHDLRHTGLTAYAQAGATHADLMYRAGHSSVETVMIYQHSSLQRDNELATRMAQL